MTLIKSISGIRGTIGGKVEDNLTPIDAVKFAAAYGTWLKNQRLKDNYRVVVGRDARISGEMIQNLVMNTLVGMGIHVIDLIMWLTGLKPTSVYAIGNKKPTAGSKFKKNSLVIMLFEFPMNILVKITANGAAIHRAKRTYGLFF